MISPWISHLSWMLLLRKVTNALMLFTFCILLTTLFLSEMLEYVHRESYLKDNSITKRDTRGYLTDNRANINYSRSTKEYLIDSVGCRIPNIDPLDASLLELVHPHPPINCTKFPPPLTRTDGVYLRINQTNLVLYYSNDLSYCSYEEIYKAKDVKSDNEFRYKRPGVIFKSDIKVSCEFLRLACYDSQGDMIYSNYHAFIQPIEKFQNKQKSSERFQNENAFNQPSILMIGLDSVSRLNFMRQMKQTREFLLNTLQSVELNGFNKVADNTLVNLSPMLAGKYLEELPWEEYKNNESPFDKYDFIWKQYQNAGYTTLFAEDAPEIAIFNFMKEGFYNKPADYYLRPFSLALERHAILWNNDHDCFRDKPETQIVLDWSVDFMKMYKHQPFFSFLFLTRLTHEDINKAGSADVMYRDYFQYLHTNGLLENTVVLFYSDHGIRYGPIRQTHIGKLEERLPLFHIVIPPKLKKYLSASASDNKYKNLLANQFALTTPFDIYQTLSEILHLGSNISSKHNSSLNTNSDKPKSDTLDSRLEKNSSKRGSSLFSVILGDRSCDTAGIEPHWCACHQTKQIDTLKPVIIKASLYTVDYINNQIQHISDRCEFLSLHSIQDALYIWNKNQTMHFGHSGPHLVKTAELNIVRYLITFIVSPGEGMYEVTVGYNVSDAAKPFDILGGPSRISRYGHHGQCIEKHSLQKYCYCRE